MAHKGRGPSVCARRPGHSLSTSRPSGLDGRADGAWLERIPAGRMTAEPLIERVNRAKARWLKRVMYASPATAIEKCFAYLVADHLNCVTLDSWPGQPTVARLLGRASTRTAQRAGRGLAKHGLIHIKRNAGTLGYRYAPVFELSDEDRPVSTNGQLRTEDPAETVRESFLQTHLIPVSTEALVDKRPSERRYKRSQRGAVEVELIHLLGNDGVDILGRLALIDDRIVDRLCREQFHGCLGPRELMAARLAAEQVGRPTHGSLRVFRAAQVSPKRLSNHERSSDQT